MKLYCETLSRIMFFVCYMKLKTFIKTSCTNNMQTGEKLFCNHYFERLVSCFFSDRVQKS